MKQHQYIGGIEHPLYEDSGDIKARWLSMPEPDIANLGKARETGVVWLCGDYAERVLTSSTFLSGVAPACKEGQHQSLSPGEVSRRVTARAKKEVRRITNASRLRYMWTLTMCLGNSPHAAKYGEPVCSLTQKHHGSVRGLWKRFARKIIKADPGLKWLVVFELHDSGKTAKEKKGTYHLHFAVDRFLDWEEVTRLWSHGNVRFDDFGANAKGRGGKVRNPGAYLSKYIGKAFEASDRFAKRYTCSRNIDRPAKIAPSTFEALYPGEKEVVYQTEKEYYLMGKDGEPTGVYGVSNTTFKLNNSEPTKRGG